MTPAARSPTISVIIVAWNAAPYLPRCLGALAAQTYRDFEVILVDNNSSDGGVVDLERGHFALDLRLERLTSNRGFAAANNIGARLARGRWLALLNADAFPQPDWLDQLIAAAASHPGAFFASRQIRADQPALLDGEGDVYHVSGLAWRGDYNARVSPPGSIREVFSACGAAALLPRREFLAVDGFDEDYFAYQEDVDLGFRLRLIGLKCYLIPTAIVHHLGSAATGKLSDFVIYHGHRNLVWTFVKDMPAGLFWIYLPLHIAMNCFYVVSYSLRGRGPVIWSSKLDALRGLRDVLIKRHHVQPQRRVPAVSVWKAMNRNLLAPLGGWIRRLHPASG